MKVAIAQINPTVGDLAGNAARIRRAREEAGDVDLVVFPELSICGYPPEDLILRPSFVGACREEVNRLALATKSGPAMVVGAPWEISGHTYNAALLLSGGKVAHVQGKRHLPNYGVFDEKRVFAAGGASTVFRFGGVTIGLMVCEDMWHADVAPGLGKAGAELLIVINASPYEAGKLAQRREAAAAAAKAAGAPLLYVNMVGAQDDIVFDGGSFFMDAKGRVAAQMPQFAEYVGVAEGALPVAGREEEIWGALKLGLADYVRKNNFPGVLLGISGGVDSALAATLAADAIGAKNVLGVLLPSPITSKQSNEDALRLAKNLGIRTATVTISEAMQAYQHTLAGAMDAVQARAGWEESLGVGGNLQARIRGTALMALSNAGGYMLLATCNKSEAATGYTTLYGDSCGGYAPLKDVYKIEVYALAKWRNQVSGIGNQGSRGVLIPDTRCPIPERSITRAPTAELAPGQKDEDQLPPYAVLDDILQRYIEQRQGVEEMIAAGFARAVVEKVAGMIRASEYKRRQMPPGAKVSSMLFGRDWRYPLTNGFKL